MNKNINSFSLYIHIEKVRVHDHSCLLIKNPQPQGGKWGNKVLAKVISVLINTLFYLEHTLEYEYL